MAFQSRDIASFKGVWVFCEQRGGELQRVSYELLSEGRKIADDLNTVLCGVLLGDSVDEAQARTLGGYGADRVYVCRHPLLKEYTTDGYTKVLCDLVEEKKPEILLIGATNLGRDLGPRVSARLKTGLTADCTHLDVRADKYRAFLKTASDIDVDRAGLKDDGNLKMTRPAFGGHLMATIVCPNHRPQMSTVRPGVMPVAPYDAAAAERTIVECVAVQLAAEDIHVDVLEVRKSAKKLVDLIGADVVVSVGRGISSDPKRGIEIAEALADVLGGVVGTTRAVVDAGLIGADHQVGQTGKTVRPRLYVALGISGAIQHLTGVQDSDCIVAVNKNAAAPIFGAATFGIVGDLFKVGPMLTEAITQYKAARA